MNDETNDTKTPLPTASVIDAPVSREYFFPAAGRTIAATSQQEAEDKLAEALKNNTTK